MVETRTVWYSTGSDFRHKLHGFFYRRAGQWRWTLRTRNGRIIGASTESYKRKVAALRNFRTVTGLDTVVAAFEKGADIKAIYWRSLPPHVPFPRPRKAAMSKKVSYDRRS